MTGPDEARDIVPDTAAPDTAVPDAAADDPVDVDALMAEVHAEVDARRARGEYPPGLEEELSGHLERITAAAGRPLAIHRLRSRLAELADAARLAAPPAALASRLPGGDKAHALVARVVGRQVEALAGPVRAFAAQVTATLDDLVSTVEEPATHIHVDLQERVDALEDRLAALERELSLRPAAEPPAAPGA